MAARRTLPRHHTTVKSFRGGEVGIRGVRVSRIVNKLPRFACQDTLQEQAGEMWQTRGVGCGSHSWRSFFASWSVCVRKQETEESIVEWKRGWRLRLERKI